MRWRVGGGRAAGERPGLIATRRSPRIVRSRQRESRHRIVAKPTGVPDLQTGLVAPGPREFEREQRIGRIRGEAPVAGGSPQPSAVCAFEDDRRRDRLAADPHDVDAAAPAPGQLARHGAHEARRPDILDESRVPARRSFNGQKFLDRIAHGTRLPRPLDPGLAKGSQAPPLAVGLDRRFSPVHGGGSLVWPQDIEWTLRPPGDRAQRGRERPLQRDLRQEETRGGAPASEFGEDRLKHGLRGIIVDQDSIRERKGWSPDSNVAPSRGQTRRHDRKKAAQRPVLRRPLPDAKDRGMPPFWNVLKGGQEKTGFSEHAGCERALHESAPRVSHGAHLASAADFDPKRVSARQWPGGAAFRGGRKRPISQAAR